MMRPLTIAACLALTTTVFTACAQENAPATQAPASETAATETTTTADAPIIGDAERGHLLTYTCQGCHGVTGYMNAYPNYHVPKIGGQNEQYLINALTEYKKGARQHPTMQAQAGGFSAQDIADIAAFLSSLSK